MPRTSTKPTPATCPGTGALRSTSPADQRGSTPTGRAARVDVRCRDCGGAFTVRAVYTSGGIPLGIAHGRVPAHRRGA